MAARKTRTGLGRWLAGLTLLAFTLGCGAILGGSDEDLVEAADSMLQAGDLPGAAAEYERIAGENPDSVAAAVGLAYVQLLRGDTAGADATLAAIEPKAGDKGGEIKLRRALVALEGKNLDQVKELGKGSALPEGKLLAAEVHLVDLESDEATALLREVKGAGGVVGQTASTYLELIESGDQHKAALAEASALWALGDREGACDAVEDSVKALAEDDPTKPVQLLLWAGRAVAAGRPEVAQGLLEETTPPEGQRWRYTATLAMIKIALGESEAGLAMFEGLKADPEVPTDGLADALATACAVAKDPAVAQQLVAGVESSAAARCLLQAGAPGAGASAPAGSLKQFLESK